MGMCGLGLVLKNNFIDTKVNDGSANINHLLRECMKNRATKLSRVHLLTNICSIEILITAL